MMACRANDASSGVLPSNNLWRGAPRLFVTCSADSAKLPLQFDLEHSPVIQRLGRTNERSATQNWNDLALVEVAKRPGESKKTLTLEKAKAQQRFDR